MEIWTGVTDAVLTDLQTLKDIATQLLIRCKSGALVTQLRMEEETSYLETTGTRSLEQYSTAANLSSSLPVATA